MARRSLRPHLNQIRGWVRQGRTDAWIAHQLEVTVQQIQAFKSENELVGEGEGVDAAATDAYEEIDLRAEDDALIAAELEAAEAQAQAAADEDDGDDGDDTDDDDANGDAPTRRRGRRGGRRRRSGRGAATVLEGTFDHGEEGYGLWLDPAVEDNPVYAEHWAGHRPVQVTIEQDQIVIRRSPADGEDDGDSDTA
jgi:hypothetical protein